MKSHRRKIAFKKQSSPFNWSPTEMLEARLFLSVTWQVQSDYFGTRDGVSEVRSLRGLALTADDQHLYGGFIQGSTSAAIREVSAGLNSSLIGNEGGNPSLSYGSNSPYTTGLQAKVTTFNQPKGLATDDRGNVYAVLNTGTNATSMGWTIYNSALSAVVSSRSSTTPTSSQLSGMATAKLGGNYYAYVGWKSGQIERWNVNDATNPTLDLTFGNGTGKISLKTLNVNAYLNGLEVDTDGTIFVAGGLTSGTSFGDALIKIPAAAATANNFATVTSVAVSGGANGIGGSAAMDVALYGGKAYVTEYLQTNSTIGVFNKSNLAAAGIITPTVTTTSGPSGKVSAYNSDATTDSGFSGIDISADGKIFVAEQLYNYVAAAGSYTPPGGTPMTGTRIYFDRIIISSTLDTAGPVTTAVAVTPNPVFNGHGDVLTVTANVDDTASGGFYITGAEFSVDHGATWTALNASDSAFDSEVSENVTGNFTLAGLGIDSPASYDVWVRGTDSAGNTGAHDSTTLVVNDGTPTANAGGSYFAFEGGFVALVGSGSSDPSGSALTYEWDLDGDNIFGETGTDATHGDEVGNLVNYSVGDQDGPGTASVSLRVTNTFGQSDTDTAVVNLSNVAPTASLINDSPINEGSSVNVGFTSEFDPSAADIAAGLHYSFSLTAGGLAADYASATGSSGDSFPSTDNGTYTVYGRIFDKDDGYTDYQTTVTVDNVAPTATISNDGPIDEGSGVTVSLTSPFDPSFDDTVAGFHYSFALSPASLATTYATAGTSSSFGPLLTNDNGSSTIYARIFDKDGGSNDYSTVVVVNNVAPTATISNSGPIDEGGSATVSLSTPSDPSGIDTSAGFHYSFALTTGALATTYAGAGTAATSAPFTFADNGTYTVYGRIFDKDGGANTYSTSVVVNNLAPTATLGNNGPVDEGTPATVSFTSPSDASSTDTSAGFHYGFALTSAGLAGTYAAAGTTSSANFTFGDNGAYTVYGRIFDKDGGSNDYTTVVTVNNKAPVAGISGPSTGTAGVQLTYTVTAGDVAADAAAGFTYVINWGDTTSTTINPTANNTSVNVNKTYAAAGPFTISVTAKDKDNATSNVAMQGVTISSAAPPNGLAPDPNLPGKTALFINGTSGKDKIEITHVSTGKVKVKFNNVTTTYSGITGHIYAYGNGNDDSIKADSGVTNPVMFFGGEGNDSLDAQTSSTSVPNVLVGGNGTDKLQSGKGQDILIGGTGADTLQGHDGNDLLIAGSTTYDTDIIKLGDLQKEWTSSNTYENKVMHLLGTAGGFNGTTYIRPAIEVLGDNAKDTVEGGAGNGGGRDFWYVNRINPNKDTLKDLGATDTVEQIS